MKLKSKWPVGIQSFNIETWQKLEEELAVFNYRLNSTAVVVTGKTSAAVSAAEVSEANAEMLPRRFWDYLSDTANLHVFLWI